MPEELPCTFNIANLGMVKTGRKSPLDWPKQPVSQTTICKANKKAAIVTTGLKIKKKHRLELTSLCYLLLMPSFYWCNCSLFPSYKCPLPLSTNQNIIWISAWINDSQLVILWSQINTCWPFLLKVLFIFRLARAAVRCDQNKTHWAKYWNQVTGTCLLCQFGYSRKQKPRWKYKRFIEGDSYEGLREKVTRVSVENPRPQGSSDTCQGRKRRQEAQVGRSSEEIWARLMGSPEQCLLNKGVWPWTEMVQLQHTLLSHCLVVAQWEHGLGINAVADSQEVAARSCWPSTFLTLILLKSDLGGAFPGLPHLCAMN